MAERNYATAGVNNLWSNAANWDTLPVTGDSVRIGTGETCIMDGTATPFEVSDEQIFTLDDAMESGITFQITAAGKFTTAAGSFLVFNQYSVAVNFDSSVPVAFNGSVSCISANGANAVITVDGDIAIGASVAFLGFYGTLTRDGGTASTTITNSNATAANAPPIIVNAAGTTTTAANAQKFKTFTLTAGTYGPDGNDHTIGSTGTGALGVGADLALGAGTWRFGTATITTLKTLTLGGNVAMGSIPAVAGAIVDFASTKGSITGTITGTGMTFVNAAGVLVGGTINAVDLTGSPALMHLYPKVAGAGNTLVTEVSPPIAFPYAYAYE